MKKLSIIIPTKERANTLNYTLRTIIEQQYEPLEIIVSDNNSDDHTKETVESFNDNRIVYLNPKKRLSMSDNWEFGLSHAKGKYITFIGDDDGFIPGAIAKAMHIIQETECKALVWNKADYYWPDHIESYLGNYISLNIEKKIITSAKSSENVKQTIKLRQGYTNLPCLYNSIVNKEFIDVIKSKSVNNRFFNSVSPDIFSGLALGSVIDNYLITNYPFSVNGASKKSNGTAFMLSDPLKNEITKSFFKENTITYDKRLQITPAIQTAIIGEILLLQKYIPDIQLPKINWNRYIKKLIQTAYSSNNPDLILQSARHTANKIKIKYAIPANIAPTKRPIIHEPGVHGERIKFIIPSDMVRNIYDACLLVKSMTQNEVTFELKSPVSFFFKKNKLVSF